MEKESTQWDLKSRISLLLRKETMCDVTFMVDDPPQSFKCHKLILGAASQVFEAMFYGKIPEKSKILVPDVTAVGFRAMLHYLYTDQVTIESKTDALEIAYVAKKYMIPTLFEACEKYILVNVRPTTENIFTLYDEVTFFEMKELQELCLRYISKNAKAIFRSKSFTNASNSNLEDILKLDIMDIDSECDLIEALWHWGAAQCQKSGLKRSSENIRTFTRGFLKHIRFLTVTVEQFDKISKKDVFPLDVEEQMAVLLNIGLPRTASDVKMPSDFSNVLRERSISNCCRIQLPTEYRYDGNLFNFSVLEQCQTLAVTVDRRNLTIVGVSIAYKPVPCYSSNHRTLDFEVLVENETTNAKSSAKRALKAPEDAEQVCDVMLEEYVVISEGETGILKVVVRGEGVRLMQCIKEQFSSDLDDVYVNFKLVSNKEGTTFFPVKQLLCF